MNPSNKRSTPGTARGRQKADTNVAQPLAPGETFLPHERDEAPNSGSHDEGQAVASRDRIEQAHQDVSSGSQDTDLHGIPSNVPAPEAVPTAHEDAAQPLKQRPGSARHK